MESGAGGARAGGLRCLHVGGLVYILGTHLGPAGSRPAVSLAGVPAPGGGAAGGRAGGVLGPAGAPAPARRRPAPCGGGPEATAPAALEYVESPFAEAFVARHARTPPRPGAAGADGKRWVQLRRWDAAPADRGDGPGRAERRRAGAGAAGAGVRGLGTYCVAESMQRAWRALLASPLPNALVLEDDFVLPHDFAGRVARCWRDVPPDWHLVFVGGCSLPFGNPTGAVRGAAGAQRLEGRPAAGPCSSSSSRRGGHGSDVLAEGLYGNGFVFQDRAPSPPTAQTGSPRPAAPPPPRWTAPPLTPRPGAPPPMRIPIRTLHT
eukprot:tig00001234_g7748.t1